MREERFYPITSLHKDDIRAVFTDRGEEIPADVAAKIDALTDDDMQYIARKMADTFCSCCYWMALEAIFETFKPHSSTERGKP